MKTDLSAHLGLEVDDLFAQERFYRTVLGFSTLYRYTSRNTPGHASAGADRPRAAAS